MTTIGDRIFHARIEKDLTQEELASRVGTTKQNIYKYEKNIITNIPMDKIEAIAGVLGVSPVWLMGWTKKADVPALSDSETALVSAFRILNAEGQKIALMNIQGLAGNPALTEELKADIS